MQISSGSASGRVLLFLIVVPIVSFTLISQCPVSKAIIGSSTQSSGSTSVDLPTVTGPIAATATSQPYRTFAGDETSLLARFDYVREEYFVSGMTKDGAFATRIMICRPKDPKKFSGYAVTEVFQSSIWAQTRQYIMRSGHMWVMISSRGGNWLSMIRNSNQERYKSLTLPTPGLNPEILAQVVWMIRKSTPQIALSQYRTRKIFFAGYSGDGAAAREFIEKHHADSLLPDKNHIFDGYFVAGTAVGSAPKPIADIDLPVIEIMNENEMIRSFERGSLSLAYRRDDGKNYRLYEIPGAGHITTRKREGSEGAADYSACVERPLSQFPMDHLYNGAMHRLIVWVGKGVEPGRAERIRYLPGGKVIARDEHGNARGGVRSTYLDVPIATYKVVSTRDPRRQNASTRCEMIAHSVPFDKEKLDELYSNPAGYARKVDQRIRQLVKEGWYLEADAQEIRKEASDFKWPAR